MLTLKNLKSPKGANRNTKRLGRGPASGQGTQAGKGHKGQKARKSGHVRLGFEGNNLPLYMRLPKVNVFTNAPFKTDYAIVDLEIIETKFNSSDEVTRNSLIEKGVLKGVNKRLPIKILAKNKTLEKKLNFIDIEKFSRNAEDLVKNAGGSIKKQ